jgi:hypothetical protein
MEENKKCEVQFKYKYNGSKYDDVGVVGNLKELKNWDSSNPVNLPYSEKDGLFISDKIPFPHNINIEYKYVFFRNNEHIWENLPYNMNRKVEIKNEQSLTFVDTEGDPNTNIEKPKIVKKVKKAGKSKTKASESSSGKKKHAVTEPQSEVPKIENKNKGKSKEKKLVKEIKDFKLEDEKDEEVVEKPKKKVRKKGKKKKSKMKENEEIKK